MKKGKIDFTVEKIEEERPKPNTPKILTIYIRSNGTLYKKAVKKADYLDAGIRKGIHEMWLKGLKAKMKEDNEDKGKIKKDTETLASLIGTKVEDEEW